MKKADDDVVIDGFSRRRFLGTAAAAAGVAVGGWVPLAQAGLSANLNLSLSLGLSSPPPPPDFPATIPVYQQAFRNWSGEIAVDDVWTCAPSSPQDIVTLANWAKAHGYSLRARGMMHTWAPLTLARGAANPPKLLLADTTQYLTAVSINKSIPVATVTAQTGVTLDVLLAKLEVAGLGFIAMPAIGTVTLGGVLAIDGHGSAIPALGELRPAGQTFGSLSNRVLSMTAVVWDQATQQYRLKTFLRADRECDALMVHLGRAFITEVTLAVGANQRVRCQSFTDIPVSEMFAPAGSSGRTFAHFLDTAGRAEAIWFPFTTRPWLKVWSVAPTKPALSRPVFGPYNYPFSDNIPLPVSQLATSLLAGNGVATPAFGNAQYAVSVAGLTGTLSYDIWGWSKDTLLYIKPTTLREAENGHAVILKRSNVQRAVNEFTNFLQSQMTAYQARGQYPFNGAVEIRASGLDLPSEIDAPGAQSPLLSALRPQPDHPEWDVVLWLNCLTIPGTPNVNQFNRELEQWLYRNFTGMYAAVRPEWSKGWGYSTTPGTIGWSDADVITTAIPNAFRAGQPIDSNWDTARDTLNRLDPHRVFSSPLLNQLLP